MGQLAAMAAISAVIATVSTVVSTGAQASAQQQAAAEKQKQLNAMADAAEYEAASLEDKKDEHATKATQDEAARTLQYMKLSGSNTAGLVTQGVSSDSASVKAIDDANREGAAIDVGNIKYMGAQKIAAINETIIQNKHAAASYRRGGASALRQGDLMALSTIGRGGWQFATNAPATFAGVKDWWNSTGTTSAVTSGIGAYAPGFSGAG